MEILFDERFVFLSDDRFSHLEPVLLIMITRHETVRCLLERFKLLATRDYRLRFQQISCFVH